MPDKNRPQLLTYAQLSELLNVPVGTLHALVHHKRIPHVRLGPRLVRFDSDVLDRFVRARQVPPNDSMVAIPPQEQGLQATGRAR
jgi:excisionase family DNA binding protein